MYAKDEILKQVQHDVLLGKKQCAILGGYKKHVRKMGCEPQLRYRAGFSKAYRMSLHILDFLSFFINRINLLENYRNKDLLKKFRLFFNHKF